MSKKKHVLSASEKETLMQEKRELETSLQEMEVEKYGAGSKYSVNKEMLRTQANRLEEAIREGEAGSLRGANKDKVARMARELEEKIKDGMLTQRQMRDATNAYSHVDWEKRNAQMIHEWKQCQRRLEPCDPSAANIERLRRR